MIICIRCRARLPDEPHVYDCSAAPASDYLIDYAFAMRILDVLERELEQEQEHR